MTTVKISHDAEQLARAFAADAAQAATEVDLALERGAIELAREARRNAPKGRSLLTNSISNERVRPGRHAVTANARYAGFVEEGAGPGGQPPMEAIQGWIQIKGISPRDPRMSPRDLAYVIRRSIAQRGTPAQPFMQPAVDKVVPLIGKLVDERLARMLSARGPGQ